MILTNKKWIADLVELVATKTSGYVVCSPGSRNAPLTVSFSKHPKIKLLTVTDERSAAFFAMGMAQQLRQTVSICCTSGSAMLNYAPAVAEAYYQKIPLLVLTADRPKELIDQSDGQTIRQKDAYSNYIKTSVELPQNYASEDDRWFSNRIINEAINATTVNGFGPSHINIPLKEPLYELEEYDPNPKKIDEVHLTKQLQESQWVLLVEEWNKHEKKLLISGINFPDEKLNSSIGKVSEYDDVAVLTETTSNLTKGRLNTCIDNLTMSMENHSDFQPDLLVTFGGQIVSKKIKSYLRKYPAKAHWHIDESTVVIDTFKQQTKAIGVSPNYFFSELLKRITGAQSGYSNQFFDLNREIICKGKDYAKIAPFSDWKAFEVILNSIPENYSLQLANSTPVRYVQLFEQRNDLTYFANRGTSGIDGSLSTAAGACYASEKNTLLITGDMAFFYDSNGLWHNYLSNNLKVIVINNGGGGIFRIIEGPNKTEELEPYFETHNNANISGIAHAFGVEYHVADDVAGLEENIQKLFASSSSSILEIKTDKNINADVLNKYFDHIK